MTILGNSMTARELFELIQRVQSGETTPEQEMVANLIPKPGALTDDEIKDLYRDIPSL